MDNNVSIIEQVRRHCRSPANALRNDSPEMALGDLPLMGFEGQWSDDAAGAEIRN